jgi:hypothetical protein
MSLQTDPVELARAELRKALAPYFKGVVLESKLEEAVGVSLTGILPLLRIEAPKPRNGATVMTESASVRRGDGSFISKPRNS